MMLNSYIVPIKQIWEKSKEHILSDKMILFLKLNGFTQLNISPLQDTNHNLVWGLTPTYSPLYKEWQIYVDIKDTSISSEDSYTNIIKHYLDKKYGDTGGYENKKTLVSQFSWLLIKQLILGNDSKVFILDKLFRKNKKEYAQVEWWTSWMNIQENILLMKNFLEESLWEEVYLSNIEKKIFYFVSVSFRVVFRTSSGKNVSMVWWYIDKELVDRIDKTKDRLFIFWMKLDNVNNKKEINNKEFNASKSIVVDKRYEDMIKMKQKDLQIEIVEDKEFLSIRPLNLKRIDLFSKNIFYSIIDRNYEKIQSQSKCEVKEKSLQISWNWKDDFFPSFPYFLEQYYGWKIIHNKDNLLEISFSSYDPRNLIFLSDYKQDSVHQENSIVYLIKKELTDVLWKNIDVNKISNWWLGRNIVDSADDNNKYNITVPKYRTDLVSSYDFIGELFDIISEDLKYSVNNQKNANKIDSVQYLDFTNAFFLNKLYNHIDIPLFKRLIPDQSENSKYFSSLFGDNIVCNWWENVLINNMTLSMLDKLLSNTDKYPRKMFSVQNISTKKWDKKHLCLINSFSKEDFWLFNVVFSEIYSLFKSSKDVKIELKNNPNIPLLSKDASFDIVLNDEVIWYLWIINNTIEKKLKWFIIASEFIL